MAATPTRKILTIDDEEAMVDAIVDILESHQYEAIRTTTWTDALDALNHKKPDLVLLDLKMPTIDGSSMLKFIRDEGFQVPVIVVSGFVTDEIEKGLSKYGVSGFVSKPFEVQQLLDEIDRALGQVPAPSPEPVDIPSKKASMDVFYEQPLKPAPAPEKPATPPPKASPTQVSPLSVKPTQSKGLGHRHRPRPRRSRIGRRHWKNMALITVICMLVSGVLAALQWFAAETDFSQIKAKAGEAITKQVAQEYLKEIQKQQAK